MGALIVMTEADGTLLGDRRTPWDPADPAQVAEARFRFDQYVAQGFRAYRLGRRGERGERIEAFDPEAGEILFAGKHGYVGG